MCLAKVFRALQHSGQNKTTPTWPRELGEHPSEGGKVLLGVPAGLSSRLVLVLKSTCGFA